MQEKLQALLDDYDLPQARRLNLVLQAVIVASLLVISLETLPDLSPRARVVLYWAEVVIVGVFTAEYLARIYAAPKKLGFIFSFWGLVDLLAILPIYLHVKEEWLEQALKWPRMMASTDVTPAFATDRLSNPNIAGTFSRLIGHYSRDQGLFDLSDALASVSLFQAQWLGSFSPAFNKKGRLQVGMDADIIIFDATRIQERADYGKPYQASVGIEHVIVAGQMIMASGKVNSNILPGERLKSGGADSNPR